MGKLKTIVESLRSRLTRDGDIRKWFNLFNENKKSRLDKHELITVLNHAELKAPDKEIDIIFELLDNVGDKKVSY